MTAISLSDRTSALVVTRCGCERLMMLPTGSSRVRVPLYRSKRLSEDAEKTAVYESREFERTHERIGPHCVYREVENHCEAENHEY